ncbi:hypothetical protein MIMGU_mgv1a002392mg [Erythranthe guttata]|uniref:PORR domain-containing protein n=1 Tax=Erythranthe guttata TaxID=4155 RepID=A0A022Q2J5_ERYGU|nr:hypothetical protein MIMGU_mgv1a002392mg [Erythranthe guttata]EYU22868.1 hypothetical protein MIMGU_mgv1a002392mg [Erythranthe guttata]
MNFLYRSHCSHLRRSHFRHQHIRSLYDGVFTLQCPRDRGLDHAVEREKHLRALLNLKNLIISEPSKSVPLTLITQANETIGFPFRPIEFIRKYPSIFEEFHPATLNIQPHIKITPETVSLSSEEDLLYQSTTYKQETANRLLKLLMISRINKIPILLLDQLKWELGLPQGFEKVLVPEFPDYFRVISSNNLGEIGKELELVCWSDEFAVPSMENNKTKDGKIQFPLEYSKGFEMDKKYKKWVDEWQKLPYLSPYENATNLAVKTDESDKWVVAVLHELLSLFVGKKAERETLLSLGEFFGLRSRFKRAFLQHPGIFYVSSKNRTHTVVLREGYKRGMLIERHHLMDMRFNTKAKSGVDVKSSSQGEELDGDDVEEDSDESEIYDSSDEEDESDDCSEVSEGEKNMTKKRKFGANEANVEENNTRKNVEKRKRTNGRSNDEKVHGNSTRFSRRTNDGGGEHVARRTNGRRSNDVDESSTRFSKRTNDRGSENVARRTDGYESSRKFSRRTNDGGGENVARRTDSYESSRKFSRRTNDGGEENVARRTDGYESSRKFSRRPNDGGGENVGRRTFGRRSTGFNESSTRFSDRRNDRGSENVSRWTNGRSSDGYDSSRKFSRRANTRDMPKTPKNPTHKLDFEDRNTRRSLGMRTNGRSKAEIEYKLSRRTDVEGGEKKSERAL